MKFFYIVFTLLLVLMMPAQCQQTAEDWFNKGNALADQGKYDEAIRAYDEVIRLDPKIAAAWGLKGVALVIRASTMRPLRLIDEAIRLDPKIAAAWRVKELLSLSKRKYDEASRPMTRPSG